MLITHTTKACNLIIFGARSDLTKRKLLSALYQLEKTELIHPDTKIIGVGRTDLNSVSYSKFVKESLKTFLKEPIDNKIWKILNSKLDFCNIDFNQIEQFSKLINKLNKNNKININYFAIPSDYFCIICKGLNNIGLNKQNSIIVIEKPLGFDLQSSKKINNKITKYFNENQIYRIDHYLGKETVLNLLALRFANSIFNFNWSKKTIDHIQITVAENIGINDRWNYFDKIGQMRDMVQSHLLQLLTIIAMSTPNDLTSDSISDKKVEILRSLRFINCKDINQLTIRGQYTDGFIKGKKVVGYLEEKGATKDSFTETFVSICVNIDNARWSGVPFYLRTGKRLLTKSSEIIIYFKDPLINLFNKFHYKLPKNKLVIRLQPNEGIDIQIASKIPNLNLTYNLQKNILNLKFKKKFNQKNFIGDYEHLLLAVMNNLEFMFVRKDEVEESWKWIDSIIECWNKNNYLPYPYKAGTWGPISSIKMININGHYWNEFE